MDKETIIKTLCPPPTLETERLIMRKMKLSDAKDMYDYASLKEVTRYVTWEPHPDLAYTKNYLSIVKKAYKEGIFFDWAITLRANGKMVGTCGYSKIDFDNNTCEIGYVVNPRYRGYGIATEAVAKAIEFAFDTLKLDRVSAVYMPENIASFRVMEKNGMKYDGINKGSMTVHGKCVDIATCSFTAEDYRKRVQIKDR